MVTLHGSCLCGEIKYEVTGEPVLKVIVSSMFGLINRRLVIVSPAKRVCLLKQRNEELETGSAFATDIVFPANSIKFLKGQPKRYNERGSSGKFVQHHFCGNCGSSIYGVLEVLVHLLGRII